MLDTVFGKIKKKVNPVFVETPAKVWRKQLLTELLKSTLKSSPTLRSVTNLSNPSRVTPLMSDKPLQSDHLA